MSQIGTLTLYENRRVQVLPVFAPAPALNLIGSRTVVDKLHDGAGNTVNKVLGTSVTAILRITGAGTPGPKIGAATIAEDGHTVLAVDVSVMADPGQNSIVPFSFSTTTGDLITAVLGQFATGTVVSA